MIWLIDGPEEGCESESIILTGVSRGALYVLA
jgi:hypothetical protein